MPLFGHYAACHHVGEITRKAYLWVVGQRCRSVHHKGADAQLAQQNGQGEACWPGSSNEDWYALCSACTDDTTM